MTAVWSWSVSHLTGTLSCERACCIKFGSSVTAHWNDPVLRDSDRFEQAAPLQLSSDDLYSFFLFLFDCALHNEAEKGLFIVIQILFISVLGFLLKPWQSYTRGSFWEKTHLPSTNMSLQSRVKTDLLYESSSIQEVYFTFTCMSIPSKTFL